MNPVAPVNHLVHKSNSYFKVSILASKALVTCSPVLLLLIVILDKYKSYLTEINRIIPEIFLMILLNFIPFEIVYLVIHHISSHHNHLQSHQC